MLRRVRRGGGLRAAKMTVNSTGWLDVKKIDASGWAVTFLLFPLPASLAEAEQRQARSHGRQADPGSWFRAAAHSGAFSTTPFATSSLSSKNSLFKDAGA